MMSCEYGETTRSGDPLCTLSAVGHEALTMRCHENCAWLVTVNNGEKAICDVIAGACGGFVSKPTMPKNPIRIEVGER